MAAEYNFDVTALQAVESAFATVEKIAGTNVNKMSVAFDDTAEEFRNGKFQVPGDVDAAGTVTFRAYVWAKTAAASKNVALDFEHLALNDTEDWDPTTPYTTEASGDKAIDATQDSMTEITWTETVSNLGWAANDMVLFRISRPDASANDLVGDMYWNLFVVEIPLA